MAENVPQPEHARFQEILVLLHNLQIHRQILQDLADSFLREHNGVLEPLAYLAGLRQSASGRYVHARLSAVYGDAPVDEALRACHLEVFEKLMETPLSMQETELRAFLEHQPGGMREGLRRWDSPEGLIPEETPDYLRELFLANWRVLLELLQDPSRARTASS